MRTRVALKLASASAAIRVDTSAPAAPQLFVHEGARQVLERRLKAAFAGPVVLTITDNRRSMLSVSVQSKVMFARVHHMFLDAPEDVMDALARFVTTDDAEAGHTLDLYIAKSGEKLNGYKTSLHTKGKFHDLTEIYESLNEKYFGGAVQAPITWMRKVPKPKSPRKTIRLGSYSASDRLIRVHSALDRAWVPRYFVAWVVYHEMLHHFMPANELDARRCLHSPKFIERERQFRHHDRAVAWERRNLGRLLRS